MALGLPGLWLARRGAALLLAPGGTPLLDDCLLRAAFALLLLTIACALLSPAFRWSQERRVRRRLRALWSGCVACGQRWDVSAPPRCPCCGLAPSEALAGWTFRSFTLAGIAGMLCASACVTALGGTCIEVALAEGHVGQRLYAGLVGVLTSGLGAWLMMSVARGAREDAVLCRHHEWSEAASSGFAVDVCSLRAKEVVLQGHCRVDGVPPADALPAEPTPLQVGLAVLLARHAAGGELRVSYQRVYAWCVERGRTHAPTGGGVYRAAALSPADLAALERTVDAGWFLVAENQALFRLCHDAGIPELTWASDDVTLWSRKGPGYVMLALLERPRFVALRSLVASVARSSKARAVLEALAQGAEPRALGSTLAAVCASTPPLTE